MAPKTHAAVAAAAALAVAGAATASPPADPTKDPAPDHAPDPAALLSNVEALRDDLAHVPDEHLAAALGTERLTALLAHAAPQLEVTAAEPKVRLLAPDDVRSLSIGGTEYFVEQGFVSVPAGAVDIAVAFGCVKKDA